MKKTTKKYKQGAASFYIVAFSTLILIVIAMSFVSIIISEITRTSNDDLAQSAYDSALAGIEDAKLAYYNYQRCLEQSVKGDDPNGDGTLTCKEIINIMEKGWGDHNCDMVAQILGRVGETEESPEGVLIQESKTGDNKMQQYYTCVMMQTSLDDVRTTLSKSNPTRIIQANLGDETDNVSAIQVSWSSTSNNTKFDFSNFSSSEVKFPTIDNNIANPPTISVGIVQTSSSFYLDDFDKVGTSIKDGKTLYETNRSTIYLVPTDNLNWASQSKTPDNYIGACKNKNNKNQECTSSDNYVNWITDAQVAKSNDRTVKNLPYAVYCPRDPDSDFACSATFQVPRPYRDEGRNEESFMVVLSIPYGEPSTDIAVGFCNNSDGCATRTSESGSTEDTSDGIIKTKAQIKIDSTGRANDLYRRVEARIETNDIYFPYPQYALELLGGTNIGNLLRKSFGVACEYDFDPTCSE